MASSPPKKASKTEQTLCCAGHRISNSCSRCKRIIEIPAVCQITGKVADEGFVQSVSETGYLLSHLSVLADACQVIFSSASCVLIVVVSTPNSLLVGLEYTIACVKCLPSTVYSL